MFVTAMGKKKKKIINLKAGSKEGDSKELNWTEWTVDYLMFLFFFLSLCPSGGPVLFFFLLLLVARYFFILSVLERRRAPER